MSKEEFDRLMETSPVVPEKVILMFKTEFSDNSIMHTGKEFQIIKPEICDALVSTHYILNKWNSIEGIEESIEHYDTEIESKFVDEKRKHDNTLQQINIFKDSFFKKHSRPPTRNEIVDNLKQHIEEEFLDKIVKQHEHTKADNNV